MNRNRWAEVDHSLQTTATDNVRAVLARAQPDEWAEGLSWYQDTAAELERIATDTDLSVDTVAEVFAALSPSNRVDRNLQDAEVLCKAVQAGASPDDITVATYNRNKFTAWAIAEGDGELSGQKVCSFARNLTGDLQAVTVDRHAFNVAVGAQRIIGQAGPKITPRRYRLAAQAYREVADEAGIAPAQAQAIAWVVWRRIVE